MERYCLSLLKTCRAPVLINYRRFCLNQDSCIKGKAKTCPEDASEILSISKNSLNQGLPISDDAKFGNDYIENKFVDTSLNERATVDLSCSMYANLPQPPNEAVIRHEQPYDSTISLGENYLRNEKFISQELIHTCHMEMEHAMEDISTEDDLKLNRFLSNEKRFGLYLVPNVQMLIKRGVVSVDEALEQQSRFMRKIEEYWKSHLKNVGEEISLFIPLADDDCQKIDRNAFINLYKTLNHSEATKASNNFLNGTIPFSHLIEEVDTAVKRVVSKYLFDHR